MNTLAFRSILHEGVVLVQNVEHLSRRALPVLCTDSRLLKAGQIFVALRGDRFDGHAFLEQVVSKAAACIVDKNWYRRHGAQFVSSPLVVVDDTLAMYGRIARAMRDHFDIPVVAVTGSNGKTSTRMMIASVLGGREVLQTSGNFNNQVGLPATLLRLRSSHTVAVVEMGTNQPGDIAALCAIAAPTHGVITNIGRAHIEKLISRDGIASEKGELYRHLPKDGIAIVNADEPLLRSMIRRGQPVLRFGTPRNADVRILRITLDKRARPLATYSIPALSTEPVTIQLRGTGRHVAINAAAALATGLACERPLDSMVEAVRRFRHGDKRMEVLRSNGVTILNDTYNANPDSVVAALDTLAAMECAGEKIVVLGDMLELGTSAKSEHLAIGEKVASMGFRYVLTIGRHALAISRGVAGQGYSAHFRSMPELCEAVQALAMPGDLVLVKGSRGMHMEDVVARLLTHPESPEGGR